MKIAFLTETNYYGKWPLNFENARTEICWQIALDSTHYNIWNYEAVKGFDAVFVIIPKGDFYLNAVGSKLKDGVNSITGLLKSNFTEALKNNNKKLYFIQEGSTTLYNDMSVEDQFYYYNHLQNFDIIFAHNKYDVSYYRGMYPNKQIEVIPTLMFTHLLSDIKWTPTDKVIIGGNLSRFYGGFQSYMVSDEFTNCERWTMTSHAMREDEKSIPDLKHIPRVNWSDWMKELSTYKYAIHLMPIIAAGTFSLNCAYYGIPCIGNENVDTQRILFPLLSVDVNDIESARSKANKLYTDSFYYNGIRKYANHAFQEHYGNKQNWVNYISNIMN